MQIIIPKRYVGIPPCSILIFLAGPVLGGGDWQRVFIEHFMSSSVDRWTVSDKEKTLPLVNFVVPCRWEDDHPLAPYFAKQYSVVNSGVLNTLDASQTVWEIFHLKETLLNDNIGGLVVFGLFDESKDEPRTDGTPYATDTRGEIGRWTTLAESWDVTGSILVGAHPEFPLGATVKNFQYFHGENWLKSNFRETLNPACLADWLADEIETRFIA